MFKAASLLAFTLLATVYGQQAGTLTAENHPAMSFSQCTSSGCTSQNSAVVLDANWRWLHATNSSTNCYTGQTWNTQLCPDATTCAQNCALDGGDYSGTYGITTSGNALTLKLVTQGSQKNVGSRVYLMQPGSTTNYQMFNLNNNEFTFDVDVSNLPCGLNGALYFVQMDQDGGVAKYPTNKAGAKFGTGYCDSQCPKDLKFITGTANNVNWTGSTSDPNSGTGTFGSCCAEMDIWEANSVSAAFTPHPCTVNGATKCSGTDCSGAGTTAGVCDQAGCDFNSFRMGVTNFYGPGMTVDTKSKFTVVTQFHTSDNTSSGTLSSISRTYIQNGKVIANSNSAISGVTATNAISDNFCAQQKTAFGDTNTFSQKGGLSGMGKSQAAGMVLVMSVWDDHTANMLWLDSDYPTNKDATSPGVARGTCATTSGVPADVEANSPNASVIFSNIKFGPIGSTTSGSTPGGSSTASSPPASTVGSTSTASAPSATQTKYGQCGGQGWTGPTVCAAGSTCTSGNPYYSQCL